MKHIYVLRLGLEKYFIGSTSHSTLTEEEVMLIDHPWLRLGLRAELIDFFEAPSKFSETQTVLAYMGKYGKENVRGKTLSCMKLRRGMLSY